MNPGDKVQVISPNHAFHGMVGILEFIGDAYIAYVNFGAASYPIHPADLQPIEEPE